MRVMSRRLDRMIRFVAESSEIEELDDLVATEREVECAAIERRGGEPVRRHTRKRFVDFTMFRDIIQSGGESADECGEPDVPGDGSGDGPGGAPGARLGGGVPGAGSDADKDDDAAPSGRAGPGGIDDRRVTDPIRCAMREILGEDAIQSGRGRARVIIPEGVGNPEKLLSEAAKRASYALGPSWSLPPPSAPARVEVADPVIYFGKKSADGQAIPPSSDDSIDEDIEPDIAPELDALAEELLATIDRALGDLERTPVTTADAPERQPAAAIQASSVAIAVQRRKTSIRTSRRFRHTYLDTMASVDIILGRVARSPVPSGNPSTADPAGTPAPGPIPGPVPSPVPGMTEPVRLRARRIADLDLEQQLRRGAEQLERRARATPLAPGRYDLVLTRDALLPHNVSYGQANLANLDDDRLLDAIPHLGFAPAGSMEGTGEESDRPVSGRYAWFEPIVAQADARATRLGLNRYPIGRSIHGGRPITGDPLTIISDGTRPYGLLSSPLGDLGEPVRRFTLVERGIATDLALDVGEAALRGVGANGGVRNLVIEPGSVTPEDLRRPARRPVLKATDLAWLDIDPATGNFTCEISLADLHAPQTVPRPTTGGILQGNIFHLLAAVRLSTQIITKGWYTGPEAIRFPDIAVT